VSRPKGYAEWAPKAATLDVISDVGRVLDEYREHLPLTVRQIFYRLVGQYGYEKTERAYGRLAEYLVRARRAQLIPFSAIRDDGTTASGGGGWESVEEFVESIRSSAEYYSRDRLAGQPVAIELWCEAGGMVPQLARVAAPYSTPVYSTGGFSSVTVTHEIAKRALERDVPTVFLHVGDFDPSGESIFEAMGTDAKSFVRSELYARIGDEDVLYLARPVPVGNPDLILRRVALTEEQVDEYELPTAPPKPTDSRSRRWLGETCQAEALPPDLLAEIVRDAIVDQFDQDVLDKLLEVEKDERSLLLEHLEGFSLNGDGQ
jgi:hypothetical protein